MGYGRDQGRKQEEESEEKIRVSSTGGPGSKASENAGERRGNKAWSARWESGPRRRLRACGEGSAGGRNGGDGGSPCAAQGREKRREAGALESGDNRSEDSVWRRRREAHGLSYVPTTETAELGKTPKVVLGRARVAQKAGAAEAIKRVKQPEQRV
ncbi:hypothetical protein DFH09DRAFT_1270712 [Mycena vulgaris]|nr:hypothetical protein DFH09DRAFT_1270712 [Mycena vulgaris]